MGSQLLTEIGGFSIPPPVEEWRNVCCFNEFRVMNSFFKHNNSQKFTFQARNTKSVIDYTTENETVAKKIKDLMCLYRCRVKHRPLFIKYKIIIPPSLFPDG
jgi:hypothetical protein